MTKTNETLTYGIFYCRDGAEISSSGSLETSSRLDSDVLRNRQQKHTAGRCVAARKTTVQIDNDIV